MALNEYERSLNIAGSNELCFRHDVRESLKYNTCKCYFAYVLKKLRCLAKRMTF